MSSVTDVCGDNVGGPLGHPPRPVWSAVNSIRLKPSAATMAVRLNCFDDGTLLLMVGVFTPFTPEDSDEARPPENNVKLTKRNRSLARLQWLSSLSSLCRPQIKWLSLIACQRPWMLMFTHWCGALPTTDLFQHCRWYSTHIARKMPRHVHKVDWSRACLSFVYMDLMNWLSRPVRWDKIWLMWNRKGGSRWSYCLHTSLR